MNIVRKPVGMSRRVSCRYRPLPWLSVIRLVTFGLLQNNPAIFFFYGCFDACFHNDLVEVDIAVGLLTLMGDKIPEKGLVIFARWW